ncbi:ATP-dependent helicase MgpS (fragment) [Candidatus Defluviicoccus seviourii]|uniref:ATP-dependent helicase MgpS n=1 Tax=Candidatus Defluviicoccus seviourii TaxID=2565273 RepID=A0A564WBC5_9PROT
MHLPISKPFAPPPRPSGRVIAVLGPTNTGKTYLAMERMLGFRSGMIGFPLRLLARENYDRAVAIKGQEAVALITGEEKICPPAARYFLCTVESMPLSREVAFLAVDEIQMCADPERGHIFTDRLLHARGSEETMFMGAETIRPLLRRLLPEIEIVERPRFSRLAAAGTAKLSRLPPRSAIVAFSAADVYAIAELIRRERGGTAIVLGALSPRTRNAQVALYQAGDVDYLVATDAIGMGLNMLIDHIAFAATRKFDGRTARALTAAELAQIAGRAGRYTRDGTFGTTGGIGALDAETTERIENHRFEPLPALSWRSSALSFRSLAALKASLAQPPQRPGLVRARTADDEFVLAALARDPEICALAHGEQAVRLLWEVCQIPDFGKVASDAHARLVGRIYRSLAAPPGRLPTDWVARQVERINRTDGDLETLMQRIANIRIWTYVAQRPDWLADAAHWQERTRAIEDGLSDALHERLVQRFVDRRTASLYGRLKDRQQLVASVTAADDVLVEGHFVGTLAGFRFAADASVGGAAGNAQRVVNAAALKALRSEVAARVRRLEEADDEAFALDGNGVIHWQDAAVGRLVAGAEILRPRALPLASELLEPAERERLRRRLDDFVGNRFSHALAPLFAARPEAHSAAVRGLLYQVSESLGSIPKRAVATQLRALSGTDRQALEALGLRIGGVCVFFPALMKARALTVRALAWSAFVGRPPPVTPERTSVPVTSLDDWPLAEALGYLRLGPRAIRIDICERLFMKARALARTEAAFAPGTLSALAGCTAHELPAVLAALGCRIEHRAGGMHLLMPRRGNRKRTQPKPEGEPIAPDSPFARLKQMVAAQ